MKVVINRCYGGFGLSDEAVHAYAARKKLRLYSKVEHGLTHYYTVPADQYNEAQAAWFAEDGNHKRINETNWYFSPTEIARDDPDLVSVVSDMGERASARHSSLCIVDVPDDVEWEINEHDGWEHVAEKHRTWA